MNIMKGMRIRAGKGFLTCRDYYYYYYSSEKISFSLYRYDSLLPAAELLSEPSMPTCVPACIRVRAKEGGNRCAHEYLSRGMQREGKKLIKLLDDQ